MKRKEDIECLECHKMFHPKKKQQVFCCRECAMKYNKRNGVFNKSEETRQKLSLSRKGKIPWNKGRKNTPEETQRMIENVKRGWTEEKRKKQSEKQKEIWSNPELLQKHSEIAKNIMTDKHKQKISLCTKKAMQKPEVKDNINKGKIKSIQTKRANKSFNTSKPEEIIYQLLTDKFGINIKRQYASELYPFACDFYIPSLNLYIEYQGLWTHGGEPFDKDNKKHLEKIKKWQNSDSDFYSLAINVWTVSDPLKRETAKKNNLNWIEFFTIDQFMEWYNKQ